MSARIGEFKKGTHAGVISASTGGVEVTADDAYKLQPTEARNKAALLVRAAEEVERMRGGQEATALIRELLEALQWASASKDFQLGGSHRQGWTEGPERLIARVRTFLGTR